MNRLTAIILGSFAIGIALSGCSSSKVADGPISVTTSPSGSPSPDNSWIPKGYVANDGIAATGVAYKWETAKENPQRYKSMCEGFQGMAICKFLSVMVNVPCTVHAILQILDQNGNVIGQAQTGDRDSSGPVILSAGQKALLDFRLNSDYPKTRLYYVGC